jgi:predicted transcriptional regulator
VAEASHDRLMRSTLNSSRRDDKYVVSDPPDTETIAELLADDCARTILVETKDEACSAAELSDLAGVSEPTVYRRLERLREHDLVVEEIRPVTDGKNYKTYQARLDGVDIDLDPDGFTAEIRRRERMADRFTRLVGEM